MSRVPTEKDPSQLEDASQHYPLGPAFDTYERRYIRLESINFENSSQRMELQHRLATLQQHLDRFETSYEHLVEKPTTTTTTTTADTNASQKKPRGRRKKLLSAVKLDLQALKDQIQNLNVLADELRSSDRKQENAGRSFDNAVQVISSTLRRSKLVTENEGAPYVSLAPTIASTSERSSDISPPIAAELEAYYAAISTLRNMGERIGELRAEQQEQWERRGVMEDQGQVLEQTEDEFLRMWHDVLTIAYNDFKVAQTTVDETRRICHATNIAIPSWAEVDSVGDETGQSGDVPDQGIVSPLNSILVDPQLDPQNGFPLMFNASLLQDHESPLATPPLLDNPMAKERIARWVDDINSDIVPQTDNHPPSTSIQWLEDATPGTEQQHDGVSTRKPQWNDAVVVSSRSESSAAVTLPNHSAFGMTAAATRPASLGAERSPDVDYNLQPTSHLPTTALP